MYELDDVTGHMALEDKEDFFLPDIAQQEYEFVLESEFASIQLSLEEAQ